MAKDFEELYDRLDELIDTDPILLRNEALAIIRRVEELAESYEQAGDDISLHVAESIKKALYG